MPVRTAIVKPGQTLPDIAIQYCGNLSALTELAYRNNLSVTADITSGQELILPDIVDKRVEAIYRAGNYCPAAGNNDVALTGISRWGIEFDFIVS